MCEESSRPGGKACSPNSTPTCPTCRTFCSGFLLTALVRAIIMVSGYRKAWHHSAFLGGSSDMFKTERLGLALSPEEKSVLEHLAEMEGGLSQAALVRRLIRAEARKRGLCPRLLEQTQEESHA